MWLHNIISIKHFYYADVNLLGKNVNTVKCLVTIDGFWTGNWIY
jgi:hypothetical protein